MVQLKHKLPTELLLGITDSGSKENKHQLTPLQVSSHGLEDYYIGLSLITTKNLTTFVILYRLQ